jgi:protein-disulfide isomerase
MHKQAELAAEAALEAFAQKGNDGFWKMHDLLLEDQTDTGLSRESVTRYAAKIGLDVRAFNAALDSGKHRAAIERDKKIAEAAGLTGTPSFSVNGILVTGAQPLAKFKKAVNQALRP